MNVKKILTVLSFAAITAFAMPNDEVELALIAKAAEKKAIVLATMQLQGEQKEKFGQIYDEYQLEQTKILGDKLNVIIDYAKHYQSLDDKKAKELMENWYKAEEEALKLEKKYAKKLQKVIPATAVLRYMQIENKFRILREAQVTQAIPLAKPNIQELKK